MRGKKLFQISSLLLILASLTATVYGYNNPIDNTIWQVNSFFQTEQWKIYGKAIEFFLFFVVFTSIYYIGGSWALKKQVEAGAKRAIIALAAALGGITTLALMMFTDNAMALLFPFAKNFLFFLMTVVVYALLLKLGMEKNKIWAGVLALVITFVMFNGANWFICEFVPDTSGPNPQDMDNRCPITDVIWENFRPDFGASGGVSDWWGGVWGGDREGKTPDEGNKDLEPDDKKPDKKPEGDTDKNTPEEKPAVKIPDSARKNPVAPVQMQDGSTMKGYFYKEMEDWFAYYGIIDPNDASTYLIKERADNEWEKSQIELFGQECAKEVVDGGPGGQVHITIMTNEGDSNDLTYRTSVGASREKFIAGIVQHSDGKSDLSYSNADIPDNRWYELKCVVVEIPECGNDKIDGTEKCDGSDTAGISNCEQYYAKYSSNVPVNYDKTGKVTCYAKGTTNECTFNIDNCKDIPPVPTADELCGNGNIDLKSGNPGLTKDEVCDPGFGYKVPGRASSYVAPNLNGKTCTEFGFDLPNGLICKDDCSDYDSSKCKNKDEPVDNTPIYKKWYFWAFIVPLLLVLGYFLARKPLDHFKRKRREAKVIKGPREEMLKLLHDIQGRKQDHIKDLKEIRTQKLKFIKEQIQPFFDDVITRFRNNQIDLAEYWIQGKETGIVDKFGIALRELISNQKDHLKKVKKLADTEAEYWRVLNYISVAEFTPPAVKELLSNRLEGNETIKRIAHQNHNGAEKLMFTISTVLLRGIRVLKSVTYLIGNNANRWDKRTLFNTFTKWAGTVLEVLNLYWKDYKHATINAAKSGENLMDADLGFVQAMKIEYDKIIAEIKNWKTKFEDKKSILENLSNMVMKLGSPQALEKRDPDAESKLEFTNKVLTVEDFRTIEDSENRLSVLRTETLTIARLITGLEKQLTQVETLIMLLSSSGREYNDKFSRWVDRAEDYNKRVDELYKPIESKNTDPSSPEFAKKVKKWKKYKEKWEAKPENKGLTYPKKSPWNSEQKLGYKPDFDGKGFANEGKALIDEGNSMASDFDKIVLERIPEFKKHRKILKDKVGPEMELGSDVLTKLKNSMMKEFDEIDYQLRKSLLKTMILRYRTWSNDVQSEIKGVNEILDLNQDIRAGSNDLQRKEFDEWYKRTNNILDTVWAQGDLTERGFEKYLSQEKEGKKKEMQNLHNALSNLHDKKNE